MLHRQLIFIITIIAVVVLSGCAQKLPVPGPQEAGLLAIPMQVENSSGKPECPFYYALRGSTPFPFEIKIRPVSGRNFALSEPLPVGDYIADTWVTYATPSSNYITNISKSEKPLQNTFNFSIRANQISLGSTALVVEYKRVEHHSFGQRFAWLKLSEREVDEYKRNLYMLENSGYWKVSID